MFKIDHTSHRPKNVDQSLLLVFLVALSLSLVGAPSAFASIKPHGKPQYITAQCLEESAYITEYKDNQAHGTGESYNNCFATVPISQKINVTSSCPGYGTGTGTINTGGSTPVEESFIQNFGSNAGCVVCEYQNGYLYKIDYPDFTLNMTVTASGSFTYEGIAYRATSDTASDHVLINNTGLYAPSCPPTG